MSYTSQDHGWAEWIGWILEDAGHKVVLQAWDFAPGSNFVVEMQNATVGSDHTIAVLSSSYLASRFAQAEWAAALASDPTNAKRKLIPVRVGHCDPPGLLGSIAYLDLVGLAESQARARLLDAVRNVRIKPADRPAFPGRPPAAFPGPAADQATANPPSEEIPFETVLHKGIRWTPEAATLLAINYALRPAEGQERRLEVDVAFPVCRVRTGAVLKTRLSIGCTGADIRLFAEGAQFVRWHATEDPSMQATRVSPSVLEWMVQTGGARMRLLTGNRVLWAMFTPRFPVRFKSTARPLDRRIFDDKDRPLGKLASLALLAKLVSSGHSVPDVADLEETIVVKA